MWTERHLFCRNTTQHSQAKRHPLKSPVKHQKSALQGPLVAAGRLALCTAASRHTRQPHVMSPAENISQRSSTHSVSTPAMCAAGSFQGSGSGYPRPVPRTAAEREESRKAARLALDTSAHGGQEYEAVLRSLTPPLRGDQVGLLAACSLCTPVA